MDDEQSPATQDKPSANRPLSPVILVSIILMSLFLVHRRNLDDALAANHQARQALRTCTGSAGAIDHHTYAGPFLRAATVRCRGNEPVARDAWEDLLREQPARLPLARAAAPGDVSLARLAADLYPDRAEAHRWLGDALVTAGQPAAAIPAYERALALEPTVGLTWRVLGDLYRDSTDDWQSAAYAYDQACYYVDHGKNGCIRAGRLYLNREMYAEAADRFRRSLRQLPGYPFSQRGLAEALLAMGQTAEALPYLESLANSGDGWAQQQLELLRTEDPSSVNQTSP